jgi:hypothetical protein
MHKFYEGGDDKKIFRNMKRRCFSVNGSCMSERTFGSIRMSDQIE